MKNLLRVIGISAALVGMSAQASVIGMFTDGSIGNAATNMNTVVTSGALTPGDGADSWVALDSATVNAMSTADLLAAYDTIVMPWYVSTSFNADWNTVLLPYLNGGGSILWEDPNNIGELAASGIGLSNSNIYGSVGESDISLVAPFGDAGASGFYHIHYSITSADPSWGVWSTDVNGGIHGVYKEFANGGRMVLGVSDNLYHPNYTNPGEADHMQLTVNQLNWLNTGSIDGIELPESGSLALMLAGLAGLMMTRRRKKA